MVEFVGHMRAEDGTPLQEYYVVSFDGSPLAEFPWGDAPFECVLVDAAHGRARDLATEFARQIVRCNVEWVATTGRDAEFIHDLVDEASVEAGRQERVGDGSPMTSWHDEATTLEQIADVAVPGLGACAFVLCVVVGSPVDYRRFAHILKGRLGCIE
jgi:hypothetical protein